MKNFKKIINPTTNKCWTKDGLEVMKNGYCSIELKDGKLSIHGVIGPMSNGNCLGSCGQCVEEIRNGTPKEDWNKEKVSAFCDIWKKWHLNDLRPYCSHQKALGWDEIAKQKVKIYHYTTKMEVYHQIEKLKKNLIEHLIKVQIAQITDEEQYLLSLKSYFKSYKELSEEDKKYYELDEGRFLNRSGFEEKTLSWIYPSEHPDGLLTRACPICDHKYGAKWIKEEVPEEILQWLYNLPTTKTQPVWC